MLIGRKKFKKRLNSCEVCKILPFITECGVHALMSFIGCSSTLVDHLMPEQRPENCCQYNSERFNDQCVDDRNDEHSREPTPRLGRTELGPQQDERDEQTYTGRQYDQNNQVVADETRCSEPRCSADRFWVPEFGESLEADWSIEVERRRRRCGGGVAGGRRAVMIICEWGSRVWRR